MTITGPGGIGKTSVALAVADRMRPGLPDGICVVDFAPLADSKLVPTALASALGIGVVSENPLPSLVALLRNRDMLIVLDNCEHVIDAAAVLAESLVQGGARLRILATSREPIRVPGEMLFHLAPLAMPEVSDGLTAPIAMTYSAVQLFVERATMCLGEFSLTDAHVPAVANICRRLDGIPLAIKMAAGRVDVFGIAGLAGVLDDRFRLAMRGRRTSLPRHQTLSTTLDWSYQLLPETERRVLRRLAVFAGFFTITEATGVLVDGSDADILESIANLAAKSLLVVNLETPCPLTVCSKRRAPTHCKSWKRAASVWHTRVGMRDNALPRWRRPTLRGKPRLACKTSPFGRRRARRTGLELPHRGRGGDRSRADHYRSAVVVPAIAAERMLPESLSSAAFAGGGP
jgi:predicted ATPase